MTDALDQGKRGQPGGSCQSGSGRKVGGVIPDHRYIARMMRLVEQLQPNLGDLAGLNEAASAAQHLADIKTTVEQLQPNLGDLAGLNEAASAAQHLADIKTTVEQLQPNLGDLAGLNEAASAAQHLADIKTTVEQLQPTRKAFAEAERIVTATAAAEHFADITRMVEQLQPNLGTSAGLEDPVYAADSTDAAAPPLSPTDQEDVPERVLEVATVELLMRLRTWCDLCDLLMGIEGLEVARLEVARQIDECLSRVARTADSDGVCWRCGGAALMSRGVTCAECAVPVAQMMLATVFLVEGL